MARSWTNEQTVTSVLSAAGMMPDAGQTKEQQQGTYVEEQQVSINGKNYTLDRISKYDVGVFAQELDSILARLNPFIWDIYAKFAVNAITTVRLANHEHLQGFKGAVAKGNELDFSLMNARQFFDPDALAPPLFIRRSTWVRVIPVIPAPPVPLAFFCDSTGVLVPYTTTEEETLIFLGWYNPATTPCSDMFQISLNTDLYDWQDLDFEKVHTDKGDVIIELKEPFILPPQEAGLINVTYFRSGTDELRPIGLWIKEAKNMRAQLLP